ncbi:MAG: hypothetical protein HOE90_02385 [Bacteriovoracaceae bacterium]|nr:hypothetical protein [Bacteriovoracaceae bacterium]
MNTKTLMQLMVISALFLSMSAWSSRNKTITKSDIRDMLQILPVGAYYGEGNCSVEITYREEGAEAFRYGISVDGVGWLDSHAHYNYPKADHIKVKRKKINLEKEEIKLKYTSQFGELPKSVFKIEIKKVGEKLYSIYVFNNVVSANIFKAFGGDGSGMKGHCKNIVKN